METSLPTSWMSKVSEWHYVPVKPQVKQRPRLGRRRKAFTPEKTALFEAAVKEFWEANHEHWQNVPLAVEIHIERDGFWVRISELEASYRPIGVLGDIDNYVKAMSDGLNTVAWDDDKQIEWLEVQFAGPARKPFYKRKHSTKVQ